MRKVHVLWRSAFSLRFSAALGIARTSSALRSLARKFQAHRPRSVPPDTSCPVTVAALRSAFQARIAKQKLFAYLVYSKQTLSLFHALRRARFILSAWKALRSAATVTGHEVSGLTRTERCAWKALRRRTDSLYIATGVLPYISCDVVPFRHIKTLSPFSQLQTNVIAISRSAQSANFRFAIFTLLLFRKF